MCEIIKNNMKKLAIIGIGKWGKNLIREFSKVSTITNCSSTGDSKNIKWLNKNFPKIKFTSNNEIFTNNEIDAVVISTPVNTHYKLVKKALLSKKHVFVEKPLAMNLIHAKELISIAKKQNLNLFVGHVFIFSEIFNKILQINRKEKINYLNFEWKKFGTFDDDIFLNLLSHDLSILITLLGKPKKIHLLSSYGLYTKSDIIFLELLFKKNRKCHIHINRCSNEKKKIITIVTSKNIYIWDDATLYRNKLKNDLFVPIFQSKYTPLELECKNFIKKLNNSKIDYDSANLAKDVIQVIQKLK